MKIIKRFLIIFTCVIWTLFFYIFVCKYSWNLLIDHGYIPFTEEYDCRIFIKNYEKNKEDFDLLINEISMYVNAIPIEYYAGGDRIRFEHFYSEITEWNICIMKEDDRLFELKKVIKNAKSIEQIENAYGDILMGITYVKEDNEYIFNIGEYYRIAISDGEVTIK